MTTVTISMPEAMKDFLDQQISSGRYGNVSEYIRSLLREEQARMADKELEALLLEGLNSGHEIEVNEAFWSDLRAEAKTLLDKHRPVAPRKRALR